MVDKTSMIIPAIAVILLIAVVLCVLIYFFKSIIKENNLGGNNMNCPKCGSSNKTIINETNSSGKNFSVGKGCCGWFFLGPFGILCGLCGKGKQVTNTNYWICNDCGYKWKA